MRRLNVWSHQLLQEYVFKHQLSRLFCVYIESLLRKQRSSCIYLKCFCLNFLGRLEHPYEMQRDYCKSCWCHICRGRRGFIINLFKEETSTHKIPEKKQEHDTTRAYYLDCRGSIVYYWNNISYRMGYPIG